MQIVNDLRFVHIVPGVDMSIPEIKGIRISPDITVDGVKIISIGGPIKTVLAFMQYRDMKPTQIVMLGQNGSRVDVENSDAVHLHMIVVCETVNDIAEVRGSIDKSLLDALKQDGFNYAHLLAGLNNGVRLAVFGSDFAIDPHAETTMNTLVDAFFNKKGRLKAGDSETNALLLIGESGDRVIAGLINGRIGSFSHLSVPFVPHIEMRNAVVGMHAFVCASHNGRQVAGVSSEDIVDFLTSTDMKRSLLWSCVQIGHDIEDIAVVDGVNNILIFTLKDGDFRLIPTIVRFNVHGKMVLVPSSAEGVRAKDLEGELLPSIVRVTKDGVLILADRNDGSMLLRFDQSYNFGPQLKDMIARSLNEQLSANRPASGAW